MRDKLSNTTIRTKRRGYSLMELVVGMMLIGIALSLIVPSGQTTKDAATTKTSAEELVARFRQARQAAMTKSVPVAVAFPIEGDALQTTEAYFLEGEVNPKVSQRWKIQQPFPEVAYYVGSWSGPEWAPAPVMKTASSNFKPGTWFGPAEPPSARTFIFTPSGNVVSEAQAADGKYRVVVAMGVQSGGGYLTAASTPYTVWISPSGEVGMESGLHKGEVYSSYDKRSGPLASYVAPEETGNTNPVVQIMPGKTKAGPKAYPDTVNPKTNNGNIISVDAVLTLEVRVKDAEGDPPYFRWRATEAERLDDDGVSFNKERNMDLWGGRFSNLTEVRMEWDAETQEWVGRDTWAAATGDEGGNRYKLECEIQDRKGGVTKTAFPVDGNFLVTSNEPWVLYKTWNPANRAELWKMRLDGTEHTPVCSFPHQDVHYGQWSPSGTEVIVGATDGVYRVSADGLAKKKIVSVNLNGGTLDGCCLSPSGDAVYYVFGRNNGKTIRKVFIDGSGVQKDVTLAADEVSDPRVFNGIEVVYDLSSAKINGNIVLLCTYYFDSKNSGFLGTGLWRKRKRIPGAMAVDAASGARTSHDKPGNLKNQGQGGKWPPYGISFATTDDKSVLDGVHVLYGSAGGDIYIRSVAGASPVNSFQLGGTLRTLSTGLPDVHHPKYASPDRSSLVFVSGRDQGAKLYYMSNINNPRGSVPLELLDGVNIGAENPSVSRPRLRKK